MNIGICKRVHNVTWRLRASFSYLPLKRVGNRVLPCNPIYKQTGLIQRPENVAIQNVSSISFNTSYKMTYKSC